MNNEESSSATQTPPSDARAKRLPRPRTPEEQIAAGIVPDHRAGPARNRELLAGFVPDYGNTFVHLMTFAPDKPYDMTVHIYNELLKPRGISIDNSGKMPQLKGADDGSVTLSPERTHKRDARYGTVPFILKISAEHFLTLCAINDFNPKPKLPDDPEILGLWTRIQAEAKANPSFPGPGR